MRERKEVLQRKKIEEEKKGASLLFLSFPLP